MAKMIFLKPGDKKQKADAISHIDKLKKDHSEVIKEYQQIIFEDHKKYNYLKDRLFISRSLCALLYICMCVLGYVIYTSKGI